MTETQGLGDDRRQQAQLSSQLNSQLESLQNQARQLSSLVGDDPQSPLLPLQRDLEVAITGIHQRLSSLKGEEEANGQAAGATATTSPSSLQQHDERQDLKTPRSRDGDNGDGGRGTDNEGTENGPSDRCSAAKGRQFAAGDPCLAPRVFDRRRARAVVEQVLPSSSGGGGGSGVCLVTWLHPRQRAELVCRYWKEGRSCKFSGPDCPFSHGVEVSMSDLLPDDDSRDWEAPSPGADAAVAQDDDDENSAAAWPLKDKQGDEEGRTNEAAGAGTTGASKGSSSTGGGGSGISSCTGTGTAKKSTGGAWLAGLRSGSRILARYHDRVWYEAAAEGPVTAGKQLSVRFRGFEEDGPVSVPANSAHLAPLEADDGGRGGQQRGCGDGGPGASSGGGGGGGGEESDLEDAWADAAGENGDGDTFSAERFFQERVLGDRREMKGGRGGGGGDGGAGEGGWDGREGGLCSDAYVFGDWEQHTKGFGSRMMNRMGYRRGEGLGKEKQGISRPVPIRVLPERRALDHLRVEDGGATQRAGSAPGFDQKNRKKSKTGDSSNHRQDGGGGDGGGMFNFLNKTMNSSTNIGKAVAAAAASASTGRPSGRFLLAQRRAGPSVFGAAGALSSSSAAGATDSRTKAAIFPEKGKKAEGAGRKAATVASGMSQRELRSHLVEAREAEATLAAKIGRLQETIDRNSERDPRTAAQARRKLEEVRLQANEVRASRGRAERALGNRGLDGGSVGGGSGGGGKGGKKGRGKGGLFSF